MKAKPVRKNKTKKRPVDAPSDFVLNWHKGSGAWVKKIKGKQYSFGSDWRVALQRYHEDLHYIEAQIQSPRQEREAADVFTVAELVDWFILSKRTQFKTPRLGKKYGLHPQTLEQHLTAAEILTRAFGDRAVVSLRSSDFDGLMSRIVSGDFAKVKGRKPSDSVVDCHVRLIRGIFKFGLSSDDCPPFKPPNFGSSFKQLQAKQLKAVRKKTRLFTPQEIRAMMSHANPELRAAIHLAANCGQYTIDVSDLEPEDLEGRWLDNFRKKKLTERRAWLWDETVEAINEVRAQPNEFNRLILNRAGKPLNNPKLVAETKCESCGEIVTIKGDSDSECNECGNTIIFATARLRNERNEKADALAQAFGRLKDKLVKRGLFVRNPKLESGWRCFRHTYTTVAHKTPGVPIECVQLTIGHTPSGSGTTQSYIHEANDDALIKISEHVHDWLFSD
ncbi:hypothetical protein [Fuerstiella marisgermanici]|uniref:Tyr recombinase domain-containing protein n=1 Tax=Fuerstiella marisgermanici TaxID=1891926 RepID=A0A1P8WBB0_9PLAN|nr:hypothetical protein [Fuerstiella marisgermanici]APZ91313.1 hypothetical protein Fuma_00901 [Fuerstiella marisgermanici]